MLYWAVVVVSLILKCKVGLKSYKNQPKWSCVLVPDFFSGELDSFRYELHSYRLDSYRWCLQCYSSFEIGEKEFYFTVHNTAYFFTGAKRYSIRQSNYLDLQVLLSLHIMREFTEPACICAKALLAGAQRTNTYILLNIQI